MFQRVTPEQFHRVEGPRPAYLDILGYLQELGGGGYEGLEFELGVLEHYGWFGRHERFTEAPLVAAQVLNRIAETIEAFERHRASLTGRLSACVKSRRAAFLQRLS